MQRTHFYNELLMEHVQEPRNRRILRDSNAVGVAGTPGRSPFIVLYLVIQDARVGAAGYQSQGCGPTIAAGSLLTELITGENLDFCRNLTVEDIKEHLGEFPPHKRHSPQLAIAALQQALDDYGLADSEIATTEPG